MLAWKFVLNFVCTDASSDEDWNFISLRSRRQEAALAEFSTTSVRSCFTVFCRASISLACAVIFASICRIQSPSFVPPGVGALSGGEPVDLVLPCFTLSLLLLFLDAIVERKTQFFTPLLRTPPVQLPTIGPLLRSMGCERSEPHDRSTQPPREYWEESRVARSRQASSATSTKNHGHLGTLHGHHPSEKFTTPSKAIIRTLLEIFIIDGRLCAFFAPTRQSAMVQSQFMGALAIGAKN